MGCYSGKSSTKLNFIPARMANGVLTSDLGGDVETCLLALSPPVLSGVSITSSVAEFSWEVTEGGFLVDIYQSTDDITYSLSSSNDKNATSGFASDLIPETLYYFKAKYVGAGGVESVFSNVVEMTTTALEAPTNLVVSNEQLTELTLNWVNNTGGGEDETQIERSLTGVGGWSQINTVAPGVTTYIDDTPPLLNGTEYFYRVRVEKDGKLSGYSNTDSGTTATMPAPSGLVATLPAEPSRIQLDWVSNSGSVEDGFEIERSLDGVSGWVQIGTVGTNIVTFTDGSPLPSVTYYYKVRAFEALGNSPYSNIDSNQIINVAVSLGDDDLGDSDLGD